MYQNKYTKLWKYMHCDDKPNKIPWVVGAEKFASVRDVFTAFTSSCTYKSTYGFLFIIYKQAVHVSKISGAFSVPLRQTS